MARFEAWLQDNTEEVKDIATGGNFSGVSGCVVINDGGHVFQPRRLRHDRVTGAQPVDVVAYLSGMKYENTTNVHAFEPDELLVHVCPVEYCVNPLHYISLHPLDAFWTDSTLEQSVRIEIAKTLCMPKVREACVLQPVRRYSNGRGARIPLAHLKGFKTSIRELAKQ